MKYNSKLAQMVQQVVDDCVVYGRGRARHENIDVEAEWAENEEDIEVTIFESCAIRFSFTEAGGAGKMA